MSINLKENRYIPNNESVIVLPAKRRKVLLVEREGQALDQHLVEFESLHNLEGVEVPNDDVGLDKDLASMVSNSKMARLETYLEAHMGLLAGSHVLAGVGNGNDGDVVVVSLQER